MAVQAYLYPGFVQNPSEPDEVTWHYSASATQTSSKEGIETNEAALLPNGVLDLFIDGHLQCETRVGGRINSDTCTIELGSLGTHDVEVIYSAGSLWSTQLRTDMVPKYPTSTTLQAVAEPVVPQKRLFVDERGYSYERMEVGQLRVTDPATPAGTPEYDCEGQPRGCLIPLGGVTKRDGSTYIPLYGVYTFNYKTERNEWGVGFRAYEPIHEKEESVSQFPEEQVGAEFFHVVTEPNPRYYVPSSATVPLDLRNVHFPLTAEFVHDAAGGSINALESPMTKVLTFGTYDKFGGSGVTLLTRASFNGVYKETEGCEYEIRIDGTDRNDRFSANWNSAYYTAWRYYQGLPAGPHTIDLWVGREEGAGPGKCALEVADLEVYEKVE